MIDIDDALAPPGALLGEAEYEAFLASGDPAFPIALPPDEWDAIALNYTSGTTGRPKGVVYHHRGAYLNALGNVVTWAMPHHPVYLWTLPMFHCNGWCFPWTITAQAGTHVCLRRVEAAAILHALDTEGVTHLCGAPIVMGLILNAPGVQRRPAPVQMMTAGAAPPATVIEGMERLNFAITHVYGLTECYGPVTVCEWHDEWDALPAAERARLKARQGVPYVVQEGVIVADPVTLEPRPQDGATMGELMMRGNIMMKGYLKDTEATAAAFAGGWFHTGDLGVWHPDGYAEIRDRAKDIIISGGENISTIEVESVLYRHPAVLEAAVVARPDPKLGRNALRFRDAQAGHGGQRGRHHRVLPRAHRTVQSAQDSGVRPAAEDVHREDAEIRTTRTGEGAGLTRVAERCPSARVIWRMNKIILALGLLVLASCATATPNSNAVGAADSNRNPVTGAKGGSNGGK